MTESPVNKYKPVVRVLSANVTKPARHVISMSIHQRVVAHIFPDVVNHVVLKVKHILWMQYKYKIGKCHNNRMSLPCAK